MNAIPTKYAGVQFRSRLEARWAAMFDLLKWQWEYEPLDLAGYIPDFRVKTGNGQDWNLTQEYLVEVKPVTRVVDLQDAIAKAQDAAINGVAPIDLGAANDPIESALVSIERWIRERMPHPMLFVGSRPFLSNGTSTGMAYYVTWTRTKDGHPAPVAVIRGLAVVLQPFTPSGGAPFLELASAARNEPSSLSIVPQTSDMRADVALVDLTSAWREAGNRVQWKSPKSSTGITWNTQRRRWERP